MIPKPFDALIFDLDDTLFETTHQLTRPAFAAAFEVMIANGLQADSVKCFSQRHETILKYPRDEFLKHLVSTLGVLGDADTCLQSGIEAFQKRALEIEVSISRETHKILRDLSLFYRLFLVTAGSKSIQKRKVEVLDIKSYFDHIFFVETRKDERKREAFFQILETLKAPPEKLLSIGNRLDIEIIESKKLGLKTCHVLKGEYRHVKPSRPFEIPDYTINQIKEIKEVCGL